MIKSIIALFTTLFTILVFLSPANADTVFPEEKATGTFSSLIVPVHDTKTKKSKKEKKQRSSAQRIRDEKYLSFECQAEDTTCEPPHKNETYNPDYNSYN